MRKNVRFASLTRESESCSQKVEPQPSCHQTAFIKGRNCFLKCIGKVQHLNLHDNNICGDGNGTISLIDYHILLQGCIGFLVATENIVMNVVKIGHEQWIEIKISVVAIRRIQVHATH